MTAGGQFMAVRFGVTMNFFDNLLPDDPDLSAKVWAEAYAIREKTGSDAITGAVMSVALVRMIPGYQTLLAHMKLEDADLEAGVRWRDHLRHLVYKHQAPRRTGGIARDWSFGYIPLLERYGRNISAEIATGGLLQVDLEAHQQALNKMVEMFGVGGRQNVVLVGATGVGKSTLVAALAERLLDASSDLPSHLKFRQVFVLDSAALIAAAPGRGELESLVMGIIGEAYNA